MGVFGARGWQPDGRIAPRDDPVMVAQFTAHPNHYLIWEHGDALQMPVLLLLLRGAQSDLVLPVAVKEMLRSGPGIRRATRRMAY